MKYIKCVICKDPLPLNSEEAVCDRNYCKGIINTRHALIEGIKQFKEFWTGKPVTEDNYREYLELVGLEDRYQRFAHRDRNAEPSLTRRMWFQLNIAQGHHEWADEFGRPWQGVENGF